MRRAAALLFIGLLGAATAWAANPSPPKATTGAASASTTSATLTGTVDSGNGDSTWLFDYGTSAAYGLTTPTQTVTASTTPATVTATITNLTPATGYHYRLRASNAAGNSDGDDKTFTTPGVPGKPTVTTGSAAAVTSGGATLNATVNAHALATTYVFQYGPTTAYGSTTPEASAGSGTSAVAVKQAIGALNASTTYHYRVVATNAMGTVNGSDHSFKTKAGPVKPSLSTSPATNVSASGATLNGKINPNGIATTFVFQYGLSTTYGSATPVQNAGTGTKSMNVSAAVGGLRAHSTYHFRIFATSANGTFMGGDRTFYTATGPLALTFGVRPDPVVFGRGIALFGKVNGAGGGVPVTLHGLAFPFSGPFTQVGNPVLTDNGGNYKFVVAAASVRTRYFATASPGGTNLASPTIVARVRVRVGLSVTKLGGQLVRFAGTVMPAAPNVRVSIQRRARGSRWVHVASANVLAPLSPTGPVRFAKRLHLHRGGLFRAVAIPNDGAHTRNVSRARPIRFAHR